MIKNISIKFLGIGGIMRIFLSLCLLLMLTSCGLNQGFQRNYIISQEENRELPQEDNDN